MLKRLPRLPRVFTPVAFLRFARNYSDGIVPDLHRVPFSSVTGTYSHSQQPKYELFIKITLFGKFVYPYRLSALFQFIICPEKNFVIFLKALKKSSFQKKPIPHFLSMYSKSLYAVTSFLPENKPP